MYNNLFPPFSDISSQDLITDFQFDLSQFESQMDMLDKAPDMDVDYSDDISSWLKGLQDNNATQLNSTQITKPQLISELNGNRDLNNLGLESTLEHFPMLSKGDPLMGSANNMRQDF